MKRQLFSTLFIFIMSTKSRIPGHGTWQQREPVFYVLVLSFQTSVFIRSAYVKCFPTFFFPLPFFFKSAFWLVVLLLEVVIAAVGGLELSFFTRKYSTCK